MARPERFELEAVSRRERSGSLLPKSWAQRRILWQRQKATLPIATWPS